MQAVTFTPRTALACAPKVRTRRARTQAVACRASSSSNDDVVGTFSIGDRCRALAASTLVAAELLIASPAHARLEGVNNPAMLPPGPPQEVLDVAGYLTKGEITRLTAEVQNLEKDTGYKLRVLAQAYPKTPGLAVKDYWNVDDDTVVFVADPGLGNILNFSVGSNVDLDVPPSFWTRCVHLFLSIRQLDLHVGVCSQAGEQVRDQILLARERRGGVNLQRGERDRLVLPRGAGPVEVLQGAG